jgi:chitinase
MYMRPNDALAHGADLFIQQSHDQRLGQIDCDNGRCESCLDVEDTRSCCGCVCMQCKWGAAGDIPPCSTCTHLDPMGEWPGPSVVIMKRGEDQSQGEEDQHDESELHSRARTKKTIGLDYKDVKVCGDSAILKRNKDSLSWRFPQFFKDVTKQWDGADGGIYDSISRYWGNSSADCADWSIERRTTRDVTHIGNNVFVP